MEINVELQPKEMELLALMEAPDARLIGYGGARGGAKSHAARACAVIRRLKYPGTKACIFRKVYGQLLEQHIVPMMEEWPELYSRYWSAEHRGLMLPGSKPGQLSPVYFRYGDTLKDINDHRGKEWGDLFVDEANDLEETEVAILGSCCRSTVDAPGFVPKKVYTFNPGGIGHAWLKKLFVDADPTPEQRLLNPTFIQSYAWDNVMWVRTALAEDGVKIRDWYGWDRERQIQYLVTRSDYGRELNALPESLRRPWLFGDWDVFAGQVFHEWRAEVHVVAPFEIPDWWRCWLSNDAGQAEPASWHLYAASPDGQVYVIREWSFKDREWYSDQAEAVAASLKAMGMDGRVGLKVTGLDSFAPRFERGKGIVDVYEAAGLPGWDRPNPDGHPNRKARAALVHEYLKPYKAGPRVTAKLQVFDTCRDLTRTLPMLVSNPDHPEEVAESAIDHWYDSLSYGLTAWHVRRSSEPRKPLFKPGTAGDILGHAKKLEAGLKRRGPFS